MSDAIDVNLEHVAPALATEWLQKNSINRNPNKATIKKYAADMEAGRWAITSDLIAFDPDGVLLNGQHRLMAVIKSGATVGMMVARGVPRESFAVTDRGRPRNYAFALGIQRDLAECGRLLATGGAQGQRYEAESSWLFFDPSRKCNKMVHLASERAKKVWEVYKNPE